MLSSIAKIPYEYCKDGISLTLSLLPKSLGKDAQTQADNLSALLDGYFTLGGHHVNVNVLEREVLIDAIKSPLNHSQLTVRVSGYAVNFIKLNRNQQLEVLSRTFHEAM